METTFSQILGIVLIVVSTFSKAPQIIKILQNKSATGINIVSVTLDLLALNIFIAYNYAKRFPFTAWGDSLLISLQTLTIAALVLVYNDEQKEAIGYILSYLAFCCTIINDMIPQDLLWTLQSCNIPIHFAGKIIQAWTNYESGDTGQLSATSTFLSFAGSLARIYTTIVETGDKMLVLAYAMAALANGIIVAQITYYWEETNKKLKRQ